MLTGGAVLAGTSALRATGTAGIGAIRAGAALGSATQTAFALSQAASGATGVGGVAAGLGGIARAGAGAATHGIRSAVGRLGDAVSDGVDAGRAVAWQATGGSPAATSTQGTTQFASSSAAPDWARRLRAEQSARAHRHAAAQAIKDGDRPGSPANPDLHMKED
jgi:type IV secretion system protein TrbL